MLLKRIKLGSFLYCVCGPTEEIAHGPKLSTRPSSALSLGQQPKRPDVQRQLLGSVGPVAWRPSSRRTAHLGTRLIRPRPY